MPYGAAATSASDTPIIPPMPKTGSAPPNQMMPPMPAPMDPMAGMPMMPAPSAPPTPNYEVRMQPDGSSVYVVPSPDGDVAKDIVLGVNQAPKLPKAMQQQPQQPPIPPILTGAI